MTAGLGSLLARMVEALNAARVPFMVAGSIASTAHGVPRSTQDVDVVIDPPDRAALERLVAALPEAEYYRDEEGVRAAWSERGMFNVIDLMTGWKIDFVLKKSRPFSRPEFDRRIPQVLLGVPVAIATAEDTVIAKLEWSKLGGGSERQRTDVAGILATVGASLDRAYLAYWLEALDLADEWAAVQGRA